MLVIKFKKNIPFLKSSKILVLLCWSCCTKDKICVSLLWKYNMLLKKKRHTAPPHFKIIHAHCKYVDVSHPTVQK